MKRGPKTLICLLCIIALTMRARAVVNDANPAVDVSASGGDRGISKTSDGGYSSIWLRNVFDLKPILPPPPIDTKPPEPPPNVKLQGITTILGDKRALFTVQVSGGPGKPPAKEESYMLSEGQRQGSLEVLEINPKARTVKIKVEELVSTITFDTNKPAGGPGPGNMAAGVPRPPAVPPGRGFNPSAGYAPAASPGFGGGAPFVPARQMRTTDNSQVAPQSGGGGYMGGYAQAQVAQNTAVAGGTAIPGSLFNQAPVQQPQAPQEPVLSPEEQTALLAIQHQIHGAEMAAGTYPPLPPLPAGTPSLNTSEESSTAPPGLPPMPTAPPLGSKSTGTFH